MHQRGADVWKWQICRQNLTNWEISYRAHPSAGARARSSPRAGTEACARDIFVVNKCTWSGMIWNDKISYSFIFPAWNIIRDNSLVYSVFSKNGAPRLVRNVTKYGYSSKAIMVFSLTCFAKNINIWSQSLNGWPTNSGSLKNSAQVRDIWSRLSLSFTCRPRK